MFSPELQRAAAPVLHCIDRERRRASDPVRGMLDDVAANLFDNGVGARELGRILGDDRERLCAFAAELGLPPADYLAEARLETALRLLEETDLSVPAVAELVGFGDASRFRKATRRYLGEPPSRLRDRLRRRRRLAAAAARPRAAPLPAGERARLGGVLAEGLWKVIEPLPFPQQLDYLRRQVQVGTPELFELLSRNGRRAGRRNPGRGLELAALAQATVEASALLLGGRAPELRTAAAAGLAAARRRADSAAAPA